MASSLIFLVRVAVSGETCLVTFLAPLHTSWLAVKAGLVVNMPGICHGFVQAGSQMTAQ